MNEETGLAHYNMYEFYFKWRANRAKGAGLGYVYTNFVPRSLSVWHRGIVRFDYKVVNTHPARSCWSGWPAETVWCSKSQSSHSIFLSVQWVPVLALTHSWFEYLITLHQTLHQSVAQNLICGDPVIHFRGIGEAQLRSITRLRVVPHFSSGIVERAKRERAWKSPHASRVEIGPETTVFVPAQELSGMVWTYIAKTWLPLR